MSPLSRRLPLWEGGDTLNIQIRDLTIGEYADNCDCCQRWEDECPNDILYDFHITENVMMVMCSDCLAGMEKLLSRVVTVKEPA